MKIKYILLDFYWTHFMYSVTRHRILYNSSKSQKWESTGFRKISMIYTLFRIIFRVLNVLYYVEKTKLCSNQHTYLQILQKIAFRNLNLMNSTFSSTIWDKSSASYACALAKYSMSECNQSDISFHIHWIKYELSNNHQNSKCFHLIIEMFLTFACVETYKIQFKLWMWIWCI